MSHLSKIRSLINSGEIKLAVSACKQAISLHPSFYIFYELLAELYLKLDHKELALETIMAGLRRQPDSVRLSKLYEKFAGVHSSGEERETFCGKYFELPSGDSRRIVSGGLRLAGKLKHSSQGKPLVSIVTVVYNNPNSLERCIKSVISQTYENVEYIVIDGGSDNPTLDIIKKYEKEIDYFVSERDRGIYHAMNKGIQVAQGDYICLLNSDDYYHPDFVSHSVAFASCKDSDITYCDYFAGRTRLVAEPVTDGVFFGHMNICHCTFLVPKECYNIVGPYDEELKIVSDVLWTQKAHEAGFTFSHINQPLFHFSDGGMSSGSSEQSRRLIIHEITNGYLQRFPFLSPAEAEGIYLLRFDKSRLVEVASLGEKYKDKKTFLSSLRNYVIYCLKRDNYRLSHEEASGVFHEYVSACEILGVDKKYIRINTKHGYLSEVLDKIFRIIDRRDLGRKCVLHFASVFSAPSETFIYDLLVRMESDGEYESFILCDERKLSTERPFKNELCVPWSDFRPEVRAEIYKYIFEILSPVALITHFALNDWKLSLRLGSLGIKVPTLAMTHGIDVFMLNTNAEYRRYMLEDFCPRGDTKLTAVSNYLLDELVRKGVPKHKVQRIYNTANSEFFRSRKTDNFFNYDRELRVLAVGRCIPLKGHSDLLVGLKWFVDNRYFNTKLTIVYGNGDECLNDLKQQLSSLKLEDHVELVPFVDFSVEKSFFTNFDIFVQPSKYSNDDLNRSESFGVSVLEAILSGLPVITTDAGGLPEVLGRNSTYSRVVPHGSGIEIGKALEAFYINPETFTDNIEYATDRFEYFSESKQLASLKYELHRITASEVKVAMFSSSTSGGAGYAAFRLFRGLRDQAAIAPSLFTITHDGINETDVRLVVHPSGDNSGWFKKQNPLNSRPGLTIFTVDHSNIGKGHLLQMVHDCDVINLHWTARFLSVENIAFLSNLNKPIVITVRDMQPITGGCHFFHGCEKWKSDCSGCPQLIDNFNDLPSKVLQAKRSGYNFSNITLVALSEHSREILRSAPVFNECRIELIPNSIETDVFSPVDKVSARKVLGLPLDRKVIGYVPSYSSEVKGYKEAKEAFDILDQIMVEDKPLVMLVGDKTPANDSVCLETVSLGFISDNAKLALAYAAADVVIVPSREETFSNTTAESISCGTPVVGCKTGAIPDLIHDGITGVVVDVGDARGLANGISKVLGSPSLSESCRKFALEHLEFSLQARKYDTLFHELVSEKARNPMVKRG